MGRKKKNGSESDGLNGAASHLNGSAHDDDEAAPLDTPLDTDRALEGVESFSERAQAFFLANDFTLVRDLIGLTRAELLSVDGAEEALVDHIVAQLAAHGWKLADAPRVADPPPDLPKPKLTRFFTRKLTAKERGDLSGQMMRAVLQRSDLQDKIDEVGKVRSGLKKEQDTVTARLIELARQRKTGTVNDEVECYEREERDPTGEDPRPGMGLFRKDTDERVEWRPQAEHERQGVLFSEGEKVFADAAQ